MSKLFTPENGMHIRSVFITIDQQVLDLMAPAPGPIQLKVAEVKTGPQGYVTCIVEVCGQVGFDDNGEIDRVTLHGNVEVIEDQPKEIPQ